ncbi:MAG: glycosyltransferase family 4 protein [Candidatus Binatia bacterium]|nr:glycosyltransferase family 4 protein [Candidatus Binatia bacterium]
MIGAELPSQLRVGVVAPCPFPSARGSQALIREVAEALAARGHQVHVISYPLGEHLVPIRGITLHRTCTLWGKWIERLPWLLRKLVWDCFLVLTVYAVVKKHRIHVLHVHNYEGPVVACIARWLSGCPVVYHAHNLLCDELPAYFRVPIMRWLARRTGHLADRWIPRLADAVVVLSRAQKEGLADCGIDPDRIAVIPPAAPELSRKDTKIARTRTLLSDRFILGYAGNLDAYQDLELLARAFCLLRECTPNVGLLLVTHEHDWTKLAPGELRAIAGSPDVEVVVCRSFEEVRLWLQRADLWVCPRSSWSGFPIKVINVAALGKPVVISSGVARGVQWTDPETIFEAGNAEALRDLLMRMVQSPHALEHAAQAALRWVSCLPAAAQVAESMERVFRSAWWFCNNGLGSLLRIAEHDLGVDRHPWTSYKRADVSREDEARA